MRKKADHLRARGIHNMHNIASTGQPMLWRVPGNAYGVASKTWHVGVKGRSFKRSAWYDRGSKPFWGDGQTSKDRSADAKAKALAWIALKYPQAEMVRCPFGRDSYVTKADLDAAIAKPKESPNA